MTGAPQSAPPAGASGALRGWSAVYRPYMRLMPLLERCAIALHGRRVPFRRAIGPLIEGFRLARASRSSRSARTFSRASVICCFVSRGIAIVIVTSIAAGIIPAGADTLRAGQQR